jgi:hypothetical protein
MLVLLCPPHTHTRKWLLPAYTTTVPLPVEAYVSPGLLFHSHFLPFEPLEGKSCCPLSGVTLRLRLLLSSSSSIGFFCW